MGMNLKSDRLVSSVLWVSKSGVWSMKEPSDLARLVPLTDRISVVKTYAADSKRAAYDSEREVFLCRNVMHGL